MSISPQTLQAIANQAGVSKMSVSRALRNKPGVSRELRQKIIAIAENLGYRPNPLITALMVNIRAQKSRRSVETGTVLAFLERADRRADARHEHFEGAAKAAEEQGYKLEPFIEGNAGLTPARLNNILLARNIRGIIIAPLPENHGYFELDWSQFCTVTIEYTFTKQLQDSSTRPAFDRVVHDSYASMLLILRKCRSRGLRRIGLCFSKNGRDRTMGLNEAAYWMEQKLTHSFSAIPPLFVDHWDDTLFDQWFRRYRPEVIITSRTIDFGLMNYLKKLAIRVPEDLSVVNVNATKHISGIIQDNESIGATATRLVIEKLNRNAYGISDSANTILVPRTWNEGATLRK